MNTSTRTAAILLLALFTIETFDFGFCNGDHNMVCTGREKRALLSFKHDLKDPSNQLSSWKVEDDCCKWAGVVCDNLTSHVLELHLRNPPYNYPDYLGGEISPSLLNLTHLNYLDLSWNNFEGIPIPSFMGSLVSLQYLNLSEAGFAGSIPHQLGNLSSLRFLSLSGEMIENLYVENLEWLPGLSHLEHLDLSGVNLTSAPNWLQVINKLPSLVELHLSGCQLDHIPQLASINLTSLEVLELSGNGFQSSIPGWIFRLGSLVSLGLGGSLFGCPFPTIVPNMTNLRHLDLSANDLNCTIPGYLYGFSRFEILDLHFNGLEGGISNEIGNLTSVVSLLLSGNNLEGRIPTTIQNLVSLKTLDLSSNQLEGRLPNAIGNLPSLNTLDLSGNQLEGRLPNAIGNLTSLNTLHLAVNKFDGRLPSPLVDLCKLSFLDMSNNNFSGELFTSSSKCTVNALESMILVGNQLSGQLPDQLGQFENIRELDLGHNFLSGPIPVSIGRLTSISTISLHGNQLNGTFPESLGHLSNLTILDVSDNQLEGIVSEVHFTNLRSLSSLYASGNQLTLNVSANWVPPFQLRNVELASWHLGPKFPLWLKSQKFLQSIDLSCTEISDKIPTWFWNTSAMASVRNFSHNQIHGEIPYIDALTPFSGMYLNSNNLSGPLPLFSSNFNELDLSNNSFSGGISHFLCDWKEQPSVLVLHLGENHVSGEIPDCWMSWLSLQVIDMANNNLTGNIPSAIGNLTGLKSIHLRNNHLSGEIPSALQNCLSLELVDLSENEFTGSIPKWMGESLSSLRILSLRSNKLEGVIPPELCWLSSIQILDLAHNNLSGAIPRCINNFTSMAVKLNSSDPITYADGGRGLYEGFLENTLLVTKGILYKYDKILGLVAIMDLSNNNISGKIPEEITSLVGLISLNLSGNHLRGVIPNRIGSMSWLGSLDLSRNQLHGEIPSSLSGLTFLSYLNLSYNHLSGRIPSSTQLQSFNASSFIGNKLCGLPLPKNCNVGGETPPEGNEGDSEGVRSEVDWYYVSMALGFASSFWCVSISMFFVKSWRNVFFRFLGSVWIRFVLLQRRICG